MPTTHEQPDFAHCKFLVFCSLQPTKSACSAAAEKCLSGVGQPLSSVSGRKRYNTLDFASKIVCKQGCSRPYWKPRAKGFHPSGHPPYIFLKNGTQTVKIQFDTFPQKIQNRCNLHPCEDEILQRLSSCLSRRFFQKLSASKFQFRADAEQQSFLLPMKTGSG